MEHWGRIQYNESNENFQGEHGSSNQINEPD